MEKLSRLLSVAILGMLAFSACKSKPVPNEPKAVLSSFLEKLRDQDISGAAELATSESQGTMQIMKMAVAILATMKTAEGKPGLTEDFKNLEIVGTRILGDEAYVSVVDRKKKDSVDFRLAKQKGKWKVDFTPAMIRKMDGNYSGFKFGADSTFENELMNKFSPDSMELNFHTIDSIRKEFKSGKYKDKIKAMMPPQPTDSTK